MKFSDYFEELLLYDEGLYLLSQFTIGFELEAFIEYSTYEDYQNFANDYFKEGKNLKFLRDNEGRTIDAWDSDSTIEVSGNEAVTCDYCNGSGMINEECERCSGSGIATDITCPTCNGYGEIECPICKGSGKDPDKQLNLLTGKIIDCSKCGGTGHITCKRCDGDGEIEDDCPDCDGVGETRITCSECEGEGEWYPNEYRGGGYEPFEWGSPIFNFIPENLQLILHFLNDSIRKYEVGTNESCGLHIHIGFPDKSVRDKDMMWILCQLVTHGKETMFKDIQLYEDIRLTNAEYASTRVINNLKDDLKTVETTSNENDQNKRFHNVIKSAYSGVKYTILRQHPQGTLEWRGPRGFLDTKRRDLIKGFLFKKLYPFIKWINDALELKELRIGNFVITKKEFREMLSKFSSPVNKPRRESSKFDMDRMNSNHIQIVMKNNPWLGKREVKFQNAVMEFVDGKLLWYNGTWVRGTWERGIWLDGSWRSGTWKNGEFCGTWHGGTFEKGIFKNANWYTGTFKNGIFKNSYWNGGTFEKGIFESSRWDSGTFKGGKFINSRWHDGTFENGEFKDDSRWSRGSFENGKFKDAYWNGGMFLSGEFINSHWNGGDFLNGKFINSKWENGTWGNGIFDYKSIWESGVWKNGTFEGIWNNGKWIAGTFNGKVLNERIIIDTSGNVIKSVEDGVEEDV